MNSPSSANLPVLANAADATAMHPEKSHDTDIRTPRNGFALVVTLLLMVLLTVIAVGLLSLSSITLRTSSHTLAMAEARQNARLAMQLAIGQLQLLTGPDTRVTASSQIIDAASPLQTGAWRSWEGSDHDSATGRPIAPLYAAKSAVSTTFTERNKRFLGWLTSASPASSTSATPTYPGISKIPQPDYTTMVAEGSVQDVNQKVYLKPTLIGNKGAIGWWTSGDNSKAMLNKDGSVPPTTVADWQKRAKSNGVPDPNVFKLGALDQLDPSLSIPSTKTFRLVDPKQDVRGFHDLTAFSRGLLTNTATGGWRKDMSLMTEAFGNMPDSGLPFFTSTPGVDISYNKAPTQTSGTAPAGSLLYHWVNYRGQLNQKAKWQAPAICSWSALVDYTQQYKTLTSTNAGKTVMPPVAGNCDGAQYRSIYQDTARRIPVVARLQFIFSLNSGIYTGPTKPPVGTPEYIKGQYRPGILITPVLTLWNPYNVELAVNNYAIDTFFHAPIAFWGMTKNYPFKPTMITLTSASTGAITGSPSICAKYCNLQIPGAFKLPPGGSMVFGMKTVETVEPAFNQGYFDKMILSPGYSTKKGKLYYLNIGGTGIPQTFPAGTQFKLTNTTCNQQRQGSQVPGIDCRDEKYQTIGTLQGFGMYYTILANTTALPTDGTLKLFNTNASDYGANIAGTFRMVYHYPDLANYTKLNSIADIYPDFSVPLTETVDSVLGDNSRPFAMTALSTRMASPLAPANDHQSLYTKGMLQTNPLCLNAELGGVYDDHKAVTTMAGSGVYHPSNAPVAMDFYPIDGWNDTRLPQRDPSTNSGYVVSGQDASDGLTRCVMAEVPTRPLQSLAELQHFDARNNNPVPPFQFNIIGNSSAQPLISPDKLAINTPNSDGMCNDDSYTLNHLLFDDWFFSSIAGDVKDFSATPDRTQRQVYEDHVSLAKALPNRHYLPTTDATNFATDVTPPTSYQTIASKLEVDGMFNINSVSVEAWKALLRQTRDSKVPFLAADGSTQLDATAPGYPYPRTTIAGDVACNPSTSTAGAPGLAEYAGYRCLTETQVDALATEIVRQIKLRGPFLSLSEFINRKVTGASNEKQLALAGTIQAALDTLANDSNSDNNPFKALQDASIKIQQPVGNADYKFPEAAEGWSAFGMPGWIRQADILRPLAPMISARDDTFTIRAYGDSRSPLNAGKITARAWCEVTVRRTASFVDATNASTTAPLPAKLTAANKLCGRKYEVVSFRWLNENEI